MTAASITAKLDAALRKFAPPNRQAYKRLVTRVGGDPLIGLDVSTTVYDTLMDPQPYYTRTGREHLPGDHAQSEDFIASNGAQILADDYIFIVSPTAMALDELQNPSVLVVLKDAAGGEEILRLLDVEPGALAGQDAAYTCYMRSTKRAPGVF